MSARLQRHIDDVIEALKKGLKDSGDGVALKTRHMKHKNDEFAHALRGTDRDAMNATGGRGTPDALTKDQYRALKELSVHNPDAPRAVLGKFRYGDTDSYIRVAERGNPPSTYFSVGAEWDAIKATTGMNDDALFDALNKPFLDRIMESGQQIHFSHDPRMFSDSALGAELRYLEQHGYVLDEATMNMVKL